MSDWTPVKVEKSITNASLEISDAIPEWAKACEATLNADHLVELMKAKIFMENKGKGTEYERKCLAIIGTENERKAAIDAEVVFKRVDKSLMAIVKRLEALRSIGASVRQESALARHN